MVAPSPQKKTETILFQPSIFRCFCIHPPSTPQPPPPPPQPPPAYVAPDLHNSPPPPSHRLNHHWCVLARLVGSRRIADAAPGSFFPPAGPGMPGKPTPGFRGEESRRLSEINCTKQYFHGKFLRGQKIPLEKMPGFPPRNM